MKGGEWEGPEQVYCNLSEREGGRTHMPEKIKLQPSDLLTKLAMK